MSEYDRDASIIMRPWPTLGYRAIKKVTDRYYSLSDDTFKYMNFKKIPGPT